MSSLPLFLALLLNGGILSVWAGWNSRQTAGFNEGGLPSHLPGPPPPPNQESASSSAAPFAENDPNTVRGVASPPGSDVTFAGMAPLPEATSPPAKVHSPSPSGPLGLSGTILILVPQFKYTIWGFPKWFGATVKLSFPITIFFDMLSFPPGSPNFPFPFGPWVPPGMNRQYSHRFPSQGNERFKRSPSVLSLPPPTTLKGGERAQLFPRLENFLKSAGIPTGRECLLRAVCEVHETSLIEGYGLFGEIITLLFSISRSSYAESHLPDYLKAEESGKSRDCTFYNANCTHSIFQSLNGAKQEDQQCESTYGESFCE